MITVKEFNELHYSERFELLHLCGEFNCIAREYDEMYNILLNKYNFAPDWVVVMKESAPFNEVKKVLEFNQNYNHEV